MQIYSGRTSNEARFEVFVDRLCTRDKVGKVSEELQSIEKMLMSQVAKELPELYH